MSPGDRCDEVIRLIDEVLADSEPATVDGPALDPVPADGVEELPGHWGVYYLRPTA